MKVFLVEDEFIVREGIKNNVDWAGNGFEFCGEASDGELAFPMISNEKPDILITDIRMPFMDGLELSRMVRKEFPEIKIIILSGHEEFEYAKAAIQIGVEEYLLKPINGEELLQVVNRVAEKIRQERQKPAGGVEALNESEILENEKRQLFNSLINSDNSLADMLGAGKKLNLNLMAACYNILLFKLQRNHKEQEFSQRIEEFYGDIIRSLEQYGDRVAIFDRAPEGKVVLFMGETIEEIQDTIKNFLKDFQEIFCNYQEVSYFGAIGKPVMRLSEMNLSYEMASHGFSYRFLTDQNQIVDSANIQNQEEGSESVSTMIGNVEVQNLDKQKIEGFLKGGEIEEIEFFVEEYMKNTGDAGKNSLIFRQYIVMDMYFVAGNFLAQIAKGEESQLGEPFASPDQMQETISSYESTLAYIADLFRQVMEVRDRQTTEHNSDIVENARHYINENYGDEELTLNKVASQVNVSPNHLSAMFSQRMGQTFVKYLTDVRLTKAKELLKCTAMRSNEICEAIGYRDPHYFSHIFKKNVGCSPMQYREGGGKD
ncbi:MAG: response regulator [Eubacterium sp.]|nr:response regulator [Eubacterium sp.]